MSGSCNFCKIVSGENPASIVYEDDNVLAFMDLHPANVGHTLVIPKEHWETIYDISEKVLSNLFAVVKRISVAVKKAVGAEGVSILQFNGRVAGQSVMHFHVHVIPRFRGDVMSKLMGAMLGPTGFEKAERKDLDKIARKIRRNL
ncbi:MAG: purine nucleoside phosphoramidase [Candidatus Bathyarchaeota archaeon BA2]|nr:MAG: purine nucleoside phosphoramidase [Candidatus Bathyarchaeota archaeon BA2]